MKNLFIILIFLLSPFSAFAAIAFGSTAEYTTNNFTSPAVSGSNPVGYLINAGDVTGTNNITGVTWGGSAMTLICNVQTPSDRMLTVWGINNPSVSATVTFTGGTSFVGRVFYYTGGQLSADTAGTGTTLPLTASVTVGTANSWTVMGGNGNNGNTTYTTSVGTMRVATSNGGDAVVFSDSNGTVSTGSNSTTLTKSSGSDTTAGGCNFSVAPFATPAVTPASILSLVKSFWIL